MPVLATMGLKKIYVTPASEDGKTMPAKGEAWKDLGDVYQDTCSLKDDDPEITEHKSETSNKVITQVGETPTSVELSLMDPDLALLSQYFGGEVKGVAKSRTWIRPKSFLIRNGLSGFSRKRVCLSVVPTCALFRNSRLPIHQKVSHWFL